MNLREDGRQYNEFRKPVLKFGVVPGVPSLQYQVNNNLLIVQILQAKRPLVTVQAADCAGLFHFQQKAAQQLLLKTMAGLLSEQVEFKVNVLAADRTLQAHLFNACVVCAALAGFQLQAMPVATSLYIKNDEYLVDDEKVNCIFVCDDQKIHHVQAQNVHPTQLKRGFELARAAAVSFQEFIRSQLGLA